MFYVAGRNNKLRPFVCVIGQHTLLSPDKMLGGNV